MLNIKTLIVSILASLYYFMSLVQGECEMSSPAGGRAACVHWEKVQQECCPGGSALQCPERSRSDPQELQPREDQTQLPGGFYKKAFSHVACIRYSLHSKRICI